MIAYVIYHKLGKKIDVTESKRIANKCAKSFEYEVFELNARRGGEYDRKLKQLILCLEEGNRPPEYIASSYEAPVIKRTRSEGHNKRISDSMKGKAKSPSHCAAIAESMIGNDNFQR